MKNSSLSQVNSVFADTQVNLACDGRPHVSGPLGTHEYVGSCRIVSSTTEATTTSATTAVTAATRQPLQQPSAVANHSTIVTTATQQLPQHHIAETVVIADAATTPNTDHSQLPPAPEATATTVRQP